MASKPAVVKARAALIGVYRHNAEEALPKDQLGLLHRCLRPYEDEEVALGIELLVFGQENIWKDGQSIYAVLKRFCDEAKRELFQQRNLAEQERRSEAWKKFLDSSTPEESAIGRHCVHLLAAGRVEEAKEFGRLGREEQLAGLPDGAVRAAAKVLEDLRRSGPPDDFLLPEETS